MITNQEKLSRDDILGYAGSLQLDVPAFAACVDAKRYDALIEQDAKDAADVGVQGTPTFILGRTGQKGSSRRENRRSQPYSVFEARIREMLDHP